MSDNLAPFQRHYCMSRIHSSGTKPEVRLRHMLWGQGFRYRVNVSRLPGSPDIVLSRFRTVVFVHGCFWHGHEGCKYYTVPKTNTEFWVAKVARNRERDQEVWRKLEALGWRVIIVWECQLKKANVEETVKKVAGEIRRNRESFREEKEERRRVRERARLEKEARKKRLLFLTKGLSSCK